MPDPLRHTARTVDLLVAGAFGVLAAAETAVALRAGTPAPESAAIAVAGLASAALLLLRRRHPVAVVLATAVCVGAAAWAATGPTTGPLAPAVALYTLATRAGWRRVLVAGAAALTVLAAADAIRGGRLGPPVTQAAVVLAAAAMVGLYAGGRAQVAEALAARAAHLEREQALRARQAVQAERMWIARELHDSIGHHVTLLVVQAGAVAATVAADHPARPVLESMIAGGQEAMTEMRRMVDLLRPVADGTDGNIDSAAPEGPDPAAGGAGLPPLDGTGAMSALRPPPGIDDIPQLCGRLRGTGLPVREDIGAVDRQAAPVSTAVYRIVQEALTNVVKHAGHVPTTVRVRQVGDLLDLRVTNAAPATAPATGTAMSGGRGLAAMRARAQVFGGRLSTGPVPGGGYAVHAVLRRDAAP
jgi:signal transduction histidine kinase